MKRLALLCVLIACAAPASAAQSAAPAIDAAALAGYAQGSGAISGSVRFDGATQALCAPDIPYVAWYVEERERAGGDAGNYDSRLTSYTHHAWVAKDRTFTFEGLAPGHYLVWVEDYTPGFPNFTTDTHRTDDPISGQLGSVYDTGVAGGSSPEQHLVGPEHVVVTGTGTTNVNL